MNVAVFRALQLGDLLCAIPAFRAIRAANPDAHIALIGLPWARSFVERYSRYVDEFVEFPGFPGMPERRCDADALPGFYEAMRGRRFDLAIQMHGAGDFSNPLTVLLGARETAGFFREDRYRPEGGRFLPWRDDEHEIERWLRLAAALDAPARGSHLEFPLGERDSQEWRARALPSDYVCVHAGSQLPSRRWPAERFAAVADALADQGLAIVLTGTEAERPITQRVASSMRRRPIDATGRTSLGGVAAIIARARLLVANDTGVSHIAAALRTPSVIVSCGSDPARWAPLDRRLHTVIAHEVACRPCAWAECPVGHPCALGVDVPQVVALAGRQLHLSGRERAWAA